MTDSPAIPARRAVNRVGRGAATTPCSLTACRRPPLQSAPAFSTHFSRLTWALGLCFALGGCAGTDESDVSPGTDGSTDVAIDPETGAPYVLCTPGDVRECTEDFGHVVVCADDGAGWTTRACVDQDGEASRCHDGQCLACSPLRSRCADDAQVQVCLDDGSGWVDQETCNTNLGRYCIAGLCAAPCDLAVKLKSYVGCEYWPLELSNGALSEGSPTEQPARLTVIVSNPSKAWSPTVSIYDHEGPVTVDAHGAPIPTGRLLPGMLRAIDLPHRSVGTTGVWPDAYRVETSTPTIAYQFNPLADSGVYSNDASLLLPVQSMDREYFVMSREQGFEGIRAYVAVVGVLPATDVTVTVTAPTVQGETIPALEAGESISQRLEPHDVLYLYTDAIGADLTGSRVISSRRVGVFGGSEGANVPDTGRCDLEAGVCEADPEVSCASHLDCESLVTCCADHIEQQLFPVSAWSTHYLAARTMPRGKEPEVWRILASRDGTTVETLPEQANVPVLNAGEWFELEALGDFELTSNHPVMVGQFMASENAPNPGIQAGDASTGDPAFILPAPVEQFRSDYVLLTPPLFDANYINIVMPVDAVVTLDGDAVPNGDEMRWEPIGTGDWGVVRVPVTDGVHTIDADTEVGVVAYGFGQYVSYGYPGGLDLETSAFYEPPEDLPDASP